MNTLKLFAFTTLITALFSCNNTNNSPKQETNTQPQEKTVDMHNAQNSLDWAGVYKGSLPCASCEEIKSTLILKNDNTFERTDIYVKDKEETFVEKGTFNWDKTNTIISLNIKDEVNLPKYKVVEGSLIMLDSEGNETKGELADKYVLKKVQ